MNVVKGKNVVFSIAIDAVYYPIFCAKTAEFVQEQDEIEVTSIDSGSSKEFVAGMMSAYVTLSGVTVSDNSDGKIAITYLMQQAARRTTFAMKCVLTDDDAGTIQASFNVFIKSNTLTRDRIGYSQSSTTFRITGGITWTPVVGPPTPEDEFAIYLNMTAGQNSVSHASLDGVTVLQVQREGVGHTEVAGTPTAGGREFKYTDGVGTGTITFDANQPALVTEVIYVLYRN